MPDWGLIVIQVGSGFKSFKGFNTWYPWATLIKGDKYLKIILNCNS